ncbi:MAG: hypothetical protein KC466_16205, partial [Myxococcales bacterium]|nr:hypothetical protein [Myxococcales bacterium]
RPEARRGMERCVAPGGLLIDIARGREADEAPGGPPWPLTRAEMVPVAEDIALEGGITDLWDDEEPPVRRFVAIAQRRG